MVRVFAPATSANLNVGFDNLGVALRPLSGFLGDEVTVDATALDSFAVTGPFASEIRGPNIVERVRDEFRALTGRSDAVSVGLFKGMPVGSGIGSSAASVVAAVRAFNEFYGTPLDDAAELELMGRMEAELSGGLHWDNILPCALGGLRLGSRSLPVPAGWVFLIAYPGIRLETKAMRAVLPPTVSLHDAVEGAARLGRFVDALHRCDGASAAAEMTDPLVEPHRAPLIPGFVTVRDGLLSAGARAAGISGSGPTVFGLFDDNKKADAAMAKAALWTDAVSGKPCDSPDGARCSADKGAFVVLCEVDTAGARVVNTDKRENRR